MIPVKRRTNDNCAACKFWQPTHAVPERVVRGVLEPGITMGHCRVRAPIYNTGLHGKWPSTHQEAWCGEFVVYTG